MVFAELEEMAGYWDCTWDFRDSPDVGDICVGCKLKGESAQVNNIGRAW